MELVLDIEMLDRATPAHGHEGASALRSAVEDVIAGGPNLRAHYIGTKDYDGFHNQGIGWTEYGYGPSHGSVRLRIGLRNPIRQRLQNDGGLLTEDERLTALAQLGYHTEQRLDLLIVNEISRKQEFRENAGRLLTRVLDGQEAGDDSGQTHSSLTATIAAHAASVRHLRALEQARLMAAGEQVS